MTQRSAVHATFCLERTYPASPARVFAAFATPEGKQAWFHAPPEECQEEAREFDFREGGSERLVGRWPTRGRTSEFSARYWEIIPGERIVYSYEMRLNGTRISVSLATIEIKPAGQGAKLTLTEQGVFLDGYDDASAREHGTGLLLDQLGASLQQPALA